MEQCVTGAGSHATQLQTVSNTLPRWRSLWKGGRGTNSPITELQGAGPPIAMKTL